MLCCVLWFPVAARSGCPVGGLICVAVGYVVHDFIVCGGWLWCCFRFSVLVCCGYWRSVERFVCGYNVFLNACVWAIWLGASQLLCLRASALLRVGAVMWVGLVLMFWLLAWMDCVWLVFGVWLCVLRLFCLVIVITSFGVGLVLMFWRWVLSVLWLRVLMCLCVIVVSDLSLLWFWVFCGVGLGIWRGLGFRW